MKKLFTLMCTAVLGITGIAFAQNAPDLNDGNANVHKFYVRGYAKPGGGGAQNLTYHTGGTVIRNANAVLIFWGPSFAGPGGADNAYAAELQAFRNQFGLTGEYNTITQYYGEDALSGYGNIATRSLVNQADMFDTTTPPQNVTDAIVQSEVKKYITANSVDYNAVYEVFLPSNSYSSSGSSTSCGGPRLQYCAYHSHYVDGAGKNVKYSIEPWPGCSGCQVAGWTSAKNQEHFVAHETRETVTDALGNAWFDRSGSEADDKCAWTPSPFIGTGGFGYQYEWSNANSGCIKTK
jgi:hypothetical protein